MVTRQCHPYLILRGPVDAFRFGILTPKAATRALAFKLIPRISPKRSRERCHCSPAYLGLELNLGFWVQVFRVLGVRVAK